MHFGTAIISILALGATSAALPVAAPDVPATLNARDAEPAPLAGLGTFFQSLYNQVPAAPLKAVKAVKAVKPKPELSPAVKESGERLQRAAKLSPKKWRQTKANVETLMLKSYFTGKPIGSRRKVPSKIDQELTKPYYETARAYKAEMMKAAEMTEKAKKAELRRTKTW